MIPKSSASARKQALHFQPRGTYCPQDARFHPAAHDAGRDGVVDQEHPDQQRDQRKRAQVQLKTGQHPFHLSATLSRWRDGHIRRGEHPELCRHRRGVLRVVEQDLNAGELPVAPEQPLRPADVQRGQPRVAASGSGVRQANQEPHGHLLILPVDLQGDWGTDLQPVQGGKFVRDRQPLRVAQPAPELEILPVFRRLSAHRERGERQVGVDVHAEDLQVLAWELGQRGVTLHQRVAAFTPGTFESLGSSVSSKFPPGERTSRLALPATRSMLAANAWLALWLAI